MSGGEARRETKKKRRENRLKLDLVYGRNQLVQILNLPSEGLGEGIVKKLKRGWQPRPVALVRERRRHGTQLKVDVNKRRSSLSDGVGVAGSGRRVSPRLSRSDGRAHVIN